MLSSQCESQPGVSGRQEEPKLEETWKKPPKNAAVGSLGGALRVAPSAHARFYSYRGLSGFRAAQSRSFTDALTYVRLWPPDMERDILAPRRRADNILRPGWGSVFLEHLMAITGDLAVGICLHVMWRRGRNRSYGQDSTAGSCHSFDLRRYPHPGEIRRLDWAARLATSQKPPPPKKTGKEMKAYFSPSRKDSVHKPDLHGKKQCLLGPLINKERQ